MSASDGDMIVYLPRQIAVTIDAVVAQGARHSIFADSSFPLSVNYQEYRLRIPRDPRRQQLEWRRRSSRFILRAASRKYPFKTWRPSRLQRTHWRQCEAPRTKSWTCNDNRMEWERSAGRFSRRNPPKNSGVVVGRRPGRRERGNAETPCRHSVWLRHTRTCARQRRSTRRP